MQALIPLLIFFVIIPLIIIISIILYKKHKRKEMQSTAEQAVEPLYCYISGPSIDSKYSFDCTFNKTGFNLKIQRSYLIQPDAGKVISIKFDKIKKIAVNYLRITFIMEKGCEFPIAPSMPSGPGFVGALILGAVDAIRTRKSNIDNIPKVLYFKHYCDVKYFVKKCEEANISIEEKKYN